MNTPINLHIFLMEQIFNKIVELYDISSTNKEKSFELIKSFDSKGNKTNWDDTEEYHFICDDTEFISCRIVQYSEPEKYGEDLEEFVMFNLTDLENIEDLEILEFLKFKIRKTKIQNIIQ